MARTKIKRKGVDWKELLGEEKDLQRRWFRKILEAEMEQVGPRPRVNERRGGPDIGVAITSGTWSRGQYGRKCLNATNAARKPLVASLAEMYVQGVSTRKVKAITEELCGHSFSASTISRINKTLDTELKKFATRALEEEYPYVILDARYEKVRQDGVIRSRAVLVASEFWMRATRRCAKTGSSGGGWSRSESTGTAGAVCWRWNWRNGKARPVGGNCY